MRFLQQLDWEVEMIPELFRVCFVLLFAVCMVPLASAEQQHPSAETTTISEAALKVDVPQPYIVKQGDTLWDIAHYFFKDPNTWLKIWEKNLYITNPDLIYPGNTIWFNVKKPQKSGGLTTVRPLPTVLEKPVERSEAPLDTSMFVSALERQDFIRETGVKGVGYIVGAQSERINFGMGDKLYVKLSQAAGVGDIFDVFRTSDAIQDSVTGEVAGILVQHHGKIVIQSKAGDVYRATVVRSFSEMVRGDRLKPARKINPRIEPVFPDGNIQGHVLYIQDNGVEAGQHQVIGISLGNQDGMTPGSILSVHRQGEMIEDMVADEGLQLPEENIGRLMVLVPQNKASLAMILDSNNAIHLGDTVRNKAER